MVVHTRNVYTKIIFGLSLLLTNHCAMSQIEEENLREVKINRLFIIKVGETVRLDDGLKFTFYGNAHKEMEDSSSESPLGVGVRCEFDHEIESADKWLYGGPPLFGDGKFIFSH